jgi:hypothetical protein
MIPSPESDPLNLKIYLPRWIIEDGNYADFCVGEKRKFALEFWTASPLTRSAESAVGLRRQSQRVYHVVGRLIFATDGVLVIDCGVLAYSDQGTDVEGGCGVGDIVQGNLSFGVDPFFYLEQHFKIPGIPPLIYEWRVNSIEQDMTPYIFSKERQLYFRDESQTRYEEVRSTSKEFITLDQGPEFILFCSKLGTEPSHKL